MARTIELKSATARPRTQMTASGAHRRQGSRAAAKTLTSAGGGPEALSVKASGNAADQKPKGEEPVPGSQNNRVVPQSTASQK